MKKNKYLEVFKKLHKRTSPLKLNDRVLLIDGTNTFIRSFSVIKTITTEGHHIGGLVGFLRSLNYLTRILEPTRVFCIFDGKGSTLNRKYANPEYKAQRGNLRIVNWGIFENKKEEHDSMSEQLLRLEDYLECLPVGVLKIEKVEADDVIAYMAKILSDIGKKVVIASTDKDFLQLINNNISVYDPIRKVEYTPVNVQKVIKVLPENYNIVKALLGDVTDNLKGVKGVGVKTLVKEFPDLIENPAFTLDDILNLCEQNFEKKLIFSKIIKEWDKVKLNFELMNLNKNILSDQEIFLILEEVKNYRLSLEIGAFMRLLQVDNIEGITTNTEGWLENFRPLTMFKH